MFPVTCSTKEVCYSYKDYLKSKHWQKVKFLYKQKHEYKCKICERGSGLELHHKRYDNIGNEKFSDLEYLCRTCHQTLHDSGQVQTINEFMSMQINTVDKSKGGRLKPVSEERDYSLEFFYVEKGNEWAQKQALRKKNRKGR